jgi:predicted RND superfamily exporter protein
MRFRSGASLEEMMTSSTPRAVLLSALTTLAAFGSLAVSGHPGLHSIGVLLSFAVIYLILCTLVVLPAMLALSARYSAAPAA